jgi:RNA polymerase sigma-32 factor
LTPWTLGHTFPRPGKDLVAARKSSTKKSRPKKPPADAEDRTAADRDGDEEDAPEDEGEGEAEAEAEEREPADDDVEPVEVDGDVEVVDEAELEKISVPRSSSKGAITRADPLALYMSEVQRHKLLTSEEEHNLAVDYTKTGNVDAAARMVTSNLRLVVKIAYEYRRAYRNIMDLIQEGNIGLMQAVKRYDPYRGVKLSSYAAWWIRAYMLRFILNNWRLVKIGTTQAQRRLFFNLNKEKARLTAMGVEPSHSTIAANLRVDEKDVVEMDRRLARGDASLDAPVGDAEGRQTTRMELLASTSSDPEENVESTELSELVRERLDEFRKTLTGKELQIFDDRVVAEDPLTLQELGDRFGVSRERVRQLEARLTGKLRTYLKSELGDAVEVGT